MIRGSLLALGLLPGLLAGGLLGAFFFTGLRWSIRRGLSSRRPVIWFSLSPLVRTLVVLVGFYFVSAGNGVAMVACLVGFVLCRVLLTRPWAVHRP
jgi:F1F0 ATPase subunit 2